MLHILRFFSLQNAVCFIMLPFFGSYIIHILHTGCAKIKTKNPAPKGLELASISGFLPRWPIISWLRARTVKETLRPHIFLTIWCSQCVRYRSTRHLHCHTMFYDHTLAEIWTLPDVYITRAGRMVESAFGVVRNKRKIFLCATDVRPDFCDITVKTCCMLHNFLRQRRLSVSGCYTNVPSRV
jgi:hypothetical protein